MPANFAGLPNFSFSFGESALISAVEPDLLTAEYRISVMPDLDEASVNAADCIVLERAEFNNIRTLSYVLAQTVALHFYETCAAPYAML